MSDGHLPQGHSISAHTLLGWCCHCCGRTPQEEAVAWRSWAIRNVPDVVEAAERHYGTSSAAHRR
jgi:hypothetical protein